MSILFYAVAGVALVTAAVLLAVVSQASGLTGHLDSLAARLFGTKAVSLRPVRVAEAAAMSAGLLAAVGVPLNLVSAFVYNRIADLTGGMALGARTVRRHGEGQPGHLAAGPAA